MPITTILPPDGEPAEVICHVIAADELEDHVVFARDVRVGAERLEPVGAVAREGRDARAGCEAQLHAGDAHPSRRSGDQQTLTDGQSRLREQRIVRGREHLHEPAGLGVGEPGRRTQRMPLVHRDQLGVSAPTEQRHHAIALDEVPNAPAQRDHLAGALEPRDVRRSAGRRRVASRPLSEVGAVDPGPAHAHKQLAVPGHRIRTFLDLEATAGDDRRAHVRGIVRSGAAPRDGSRLRLCS